MAKKAEFLWVSEVELCHVEMNSPYTSVNSRWILTAIFSAGKMNDCDSKSDEEEDSFVSCRMASRGCLRSADAFCYVCGHFIKTRARKYSVKACRKMCEAYKAYFGMPVGDQDKSWAPHVTCEYCKKTLEGWYRGEKRAMKFAIPRIWREPTDHSNNCYFCMVEPTKRRTGKNAPQIVYPDIPSSIAPVPHCPQLPVPTPPTRDRSSSGDNSKSDSEEDTGDLECDFTDADDEKRPYFPNQKDINDLIRDLGLTKSNAELLTSRLKQWNLLDESVQVTEQRSRHQTVSTFFISLLCDIYPATLLLLHELITKSHIALIYMKGSNWLGVVLDS
ncbi:uncharacterized protein ACMZJ9_020063 [Mantella aurantiaca]